MASNHRTWQFKQSFEALPKSVQSLAESQFKLFRENPSHPSLRHHQLDETKRGRHEKGSCSVSITMKYRAIYVYITDQDVNLWYWIGNHNDYNSFTGRK
ncbi:hypothetical protein [Calycomorphotria hydatis]|uniref:mRNA interferase HigB n=1 Tax=Calycomorphotria hydatis TaxID=2528027 RepID=A0A517TFC5_9PLAN|nr:hypothetical protein [Calycomorphotria hydatis]QDT67079.1 hypothetical protein V22_43520 [Calycomorphotria hydatis]